MKLYRFTCHYKATFNPAVAINPISPIDRMINLDLIKQDNGEFEPESLDNWSKNLVNVMANDLAVFGSQTAVGGSLIIKDAYQEPIFTLLLNSVESFKACLEFLKRKDFDNASNKALINPAASSIVHKFNSDRLNRKVVYIEQAQEDDSSMCNSICRKFTDLLI